METMNVKKWYFRKCCLLFINLAGQQTKISMIMSEDEMNAKNNETDQSADSLCGRAVLPWDVFQLDKVTTIIHRPFVLSWSGIWAFREWGGDDHNQTGQEDSHHHLQASQAPRVSGKTHWQDWCNSNIILTSLCHRCVRHTDDMLY